MNQNRLLQKTTEHYQEFPFDFLTEEDESQIELHQPKPFLKFVEDYISAGTRVVEVGCGPGRGTMFLDKLGTDLLAIDIAPGSITLARRRAPNTVFIQATNTQLPIKNNVFDVVVSDGVIHHTPDAYQSFCENARVLKGNGMLYLGVYRRKRYYYYIYNHIGRPVRWLEKRTWGKVFISLTLLPLYYVVHLFKSRGKRTWLGAQNFFYDYIITPQASFHTREEVTEWGIKNQLELIDYVENVGNIHVFIFRKGSMKNNDK